MIRDGFQFRVESLVRLSRQEVEYLEQAARRHYDGRCQQAARSGIISTARLLLEGDECKIVLTWQDVDLLCKLLELEHLLPEPRCMYLEMMKLLNQMRAESERVNHDDTVYVG